jgi:hypothetical protein
VFPQNVDLFESDENDDEDEKDKKSKFCNGNGDEGNKNTAECDDGGGSDKGKGYHQSLVDATEERTLNECEADQTFYDPTEGGLDKFFVYASTYWLKHFCSFGDEECLELGKIEGLCESGPTRIDNWIKQHRRPSCAIKPRSTLSGCRNDPLSITSLYGTDSMLTYMLENADFKCKKHLQSSVLEAAYWSMERCNLEKLKILFLAAKPGRSLLWSLIFFASIVDYWRDFRGLHENWDDAINLVDQVADTLNKEQWGKDLFWAAACAGCHPMINRLLGEAQHNPALKNETLQCDVSVMDAVLGKHVVIVERLMREQGFETHLLYVNSKDENVLQAASTKCEVKTFHTLLPRMRVFIHSADNDGETALVRIIKVEKVHADHADCCECISAILYCKFGTNFQVTNGYDDSNDLLRLAIQHGYVDMSRILLAEGGFDTLPALIRGADGQFALRATSEKNHNALLLLLREYASAVTQVP